MPVFEKTSGGEVLLRGIGERVSIGDRVDADEAFADYLRDRGDFAIVDDAGGDGSRTPDEDVHDEDGPPDEATPPFDPSESTIDEIESALEETTHHPVALRALLDAEENGKDRTGATEAIEAHISTTEEV